LLTPVKLVKPVLMAPGARQFTLICRGATSTANDCAIDSAAFVLVYIACEGNVRLALMELITIFEPLFLYSFILLTDACSQLIKPAFITP
jgi:hypothetical protein